MMFNENSTYTTTGTETVLTKEILYEAIEKIKKFQSKIPVYEYDTIIMNDYTRLKFKELYGYEIEHGKKISNVTFYISELAPNNKIVQMNKPNYFLNYLQKSKKTDIVIIDISEFKTFNEREDKNEI